MDRGGNFGKIEKIRRYIESGEYSKALGIAKTIDTTKLKSAADIGAIAEAYYKNGEFETALIYYEQVYQKTRTRRILISLINLCLKLSMADAAEFYLGDFEKMAPKDFYCHIFRYRIDKLREESLDTLISDLELLKENNYMEDWAYELAKLYHKSGQREKCIEECDNIILWFGSGTYVDRARGLRAINLVGRPEAALTDKDVELVQEVRRLVGSGRSTEEVENFIEESTTPSGRVKDFSEEEYRTERFGKPVYEEDGKDVIWYTQEFGPITEEMIRQQNTMDMLQGMQVAEQIRMQLGKDYEMEVEGQQDGRERGQEEQGGWQLGENMRQDAVGGPLVGDGPAGHTESSVTGEHMETGGMAAGSAGQGQEGIQPARKSIWERRREEKERRKKGQGAKTAGQEQKVGWDARPDQEAEEKLYLMLQEDEQAAELSRAVKGVTDSLLSSLQEEGQPEENGQEKPGEESAKGQGTVSEVEIADVPETAVPEPPPSGQEAVALEDLEEGQDTGQVPCPQEGAVEEVPLEIFQYPDEVMPAAYTEESGEFCQNLAGHGMKSEEFFASFMISGELRQKLLESMEQIYASRDKNIAVIITGGAKSGITFLAKRIAKCLQVMKILPSPRVAVIKGAKLNRIRLAEKKGQLKDATLIVESAAEMKPLKVAELLSLAGDFAGTTAVILEDERGRMNRLLRDNENLERVYKIRIDIPEWTTDENFLQALAMLAAKDFVMDKLVARQFLENVRGQIAGHPNDVYGAVCGYTEQVIRNTEKRMASELKELVLQGRCYDANMRLMRMEDLTE